METLLDLERDGTEQSLFTDPIPREPIRELIVLSPTTGNYDYVKYVPNTQSNKCRSIMLILGLQEVSGVMWLQILIGHFIQTRLLEESIYDKTSD